MNSDKNSIVTRTIVNEIVAWIAASLLLFSSLYFLSRYSYILFHSIIEFLSVTVGWAIFIIAWNIRKRFGNGFLLIFGIGLLFIGIFDFLHALTYKGMGVLSSTNGNHPTQLWIAARFLESLSLAVAFFLTGKKPRLSIILTIYFFVTIAAIVFIFVIPIFPDCYVDGVGLTSFKIISEYIISVFLIISAIVFYINRDFFEKKLYPYIFIMLLTKIVAELFFTAYVSVYGPGKFLWTYRKGGFPWTHLLYLYLFRCD